MHPAVVLRDAASGRWLRFAHPVDIVAVHTRDEVSRALRRVEARVNTDGLWAAGFVSYDAAPAFDDALRARSGSSEPLLWFGLFNEPTEISAPATEDAAPALDWSPTLSRADYDAAIEQIKNHIADGDTYQVNFTFRLEAPCTTDAWRLFASLVDAQPASYAAFIDTGRRAICSVSPELFFTLDDDRLTSRPMKGTAGRGRFTAEDQQRAEWLHTSAKNRAENVMIVDMIRNDIGRIADVGSVAVTDLFAAERYPTLWQMTSTVTGRTRASVADIMAALFPCASITGAPKARTTAIIAALETTPRGVYTGTIGFIAPGRRAQFNVAIRTVVIDKDTATATYGVGSGVTWDSDTNAEYDECLTKARVLAARRPAFDLLETLRWTPADGYALIDQHLARVRRSADYFDRPFDDGRVREALSSAAVAFSEAPHMVRLLISADGSVRCEGRALVALPDPVRVALARTPVSSTNIFLFHKTTHREIYDTARRECPDADDVLLWNERGEVTETCIANVIVELDGQRWTPPVACGLLAGTLRDEMLARGDIRERVMTRDDLARATRITLINSVRGELSAVLV